MTGIETVAVIGAVGFTKLTLVPDAPLTVKSPGAVAESVAGTGSTITIGQVAAQTLALSGTSNYVVSGGTTGAITSTGSGTLSVTASANSQAVTSASATTIVGAALGATSTAGGTGANTAFTYTGVGTVANAIVTEAATFTGTLTVNTVDTAASAVTQASTAASVGAFVLNASDDGAGGTGLVTLTALSNHASQTINMTSTAGTAVLVTVDAASTATAYTINGLGAGAHTYVADSNTSAVDTFIGGAGVDTVTLAGGADRFTTGGGADVFNMTAASDTGIVAGFSTGAAAPAQGANINVTGCDIITVTGAAAAFTVVLTFAAVAAVTAPLIVRNGSTNIGADTTAQLVQLTGTYSSTTGLFTVDTGGTSTLLVYDDTADSAAGNYRGVVLVGYVDTGAADTWVTVPATEIGTFTATL